MKYHSTLSTVVISISIALLFLFVSGFILVSLNLTSPTLMLTNKLFDSWENANSDISIEFSSIERNLRDRVFINGLSISYKDEEMLYFDKLQLKRGLFSMIGYILSGNGVLDITGENGRIVIPNIVSENESSEINTIDKDPLSFLYDSLDIVLPEEIFSWGIELDLKNIDISYKDLLIENANMDLFFDHGFEDFSANFTIPIFNYSLNGFDIESNDIALVAKYEDSFDISFDIESANVNGSDFSADITKLGFNVEIQELNTFIPIDIPLQLSFDSLEIAYKEFTSTVTKGAAEFIDRTLSVDIESASGEYEQFGLDITNLQSSLSSFNAISILIDNIGVTNNEESILDSANSEITLDLPSKAIRVDLPSTCIRAFDESTNGLIESLYINDLDGLIDFDSGLSSSIYANAVIKSNDSFITDTSMNLFVGFRSSDNEFDYQAKIENLKLPMIDESLNAKLSGNKYGTNLSLGFGEYIAANAIFDNSLSLDLNIELLPLSIVLPVIEHYVPAFRSYISDETKLSANLFSEFEKNEMARFGYVGTIESNFELDNVRFNDYSFDLSSEMKSKLNEEALVFDSFKVNSDLFNVDYQGSLSFVSKLPEGRFSIYGNDNKEFFVLDMSASNLREYTFYAESPMLDNLNIYGVINFATENIIASDATLNLFNRINPFDLRIDLANKLLTMDNDNIDIDVNWSDILNISIVFNDLQLSSIEKENNISTFDLDFDFEFDFARQRFDLNVPIFYIDNIMLISTNNSLSFSALGNNELVSIDDILINSSGYADMHGSALLDLEKDSFAFYISDESLEKYMLSVLKQEDGYFGILRGESINLGRFGLDDMIGTLNLTGRAERLSDFAFSGKFSAIARDSINDSRRINANLYIDNNLLTLNDFGYQNDSLSLLIPVFSFDSINGIVSLDGAEIIKTMAHSDRDYVISGGLSAKANLEPSTSLIDSMYNIFKTKGDGISADISIDYLDIDRTLRFENRSFEMRFDDNLLTLFGDFSSGYFDLANMVMNIRVNADPIGVFTVDGKLDREKGNSFKINIEKLAIPITNLVFPSPVLVFHNPAYLAGEINILTNDDGLNVFGSLICNYAEFDVWWLTNERVILHNATFVIWDNDITSVLTDATVLNTETFERIPAKINLGLHFDDSFGFDSWDLDVYIDDPYSINFRLPMVDSNMDIKGKVSGHYRIEATNSIIKNSGDLTVKDVVLSIGMDELPYWWNSEIKTTSDFNLLLKENSQFVYPLGPNPILQANLADNTRIGFTMNENGQLNISGDISLRSGEIFYFQKYFYITEGTIGFRNDSSGIDPIVNLRARLRDFDAEGESVDIYLVLRDATLDNLSPTFESSPNKDINEILSILGQAILPSTAYGDTSLTTVVSMAAASVDILSRVGLIGSVDNGLNSTIRDSLAIDTFSLHTNILSNLVADTVSLAASSSGINAFSPMARYLDGTSLYLGKYLSPKLYLQAMVHLSANRKNEKNRFSFIADDLIMDTEISLEWTNPLCTVTFFSQPVNLTPYGLIDSFGFSLTKRLVF